MHNILSDYIGKAIQFYPLNLLHYPVKEIYANVDPTVDLINPAQHVRKAH